MTFAWLYGTRGSAEAEGKRERGREGKGIEFRNEEFRCVVPAISERHPTKTK